jgi:hypothetical protein
MIRHAKGLVSALLPAVPLVLFPGCGGGGSEDGPSAANPPAVSAPVVVDTPPAVAALADGHARVGQQYQLQVSATDPEGESLLFTAQNLPPWASIDPATGLISGTPGEVDVGVYEGIRIVVADGTHTTQGAPFTVTVTADPGTGYASLRWEMPLSKVDGSPLDDLAGYRILYGQHASDLDQSVLIDDPAITSFEFTALEPGIWYFAVVAVNASGLEGPPTIMATKSI